MRVNGGDLGLLGLGTLDGQLRVSFGPPGADFKAPPQGFGQGEPIEGYSPLWGDQSRIVGFTQERTGAGIGDGVKLDLWGQGRQRLAHWCSP